jgi:hypothetical protein
MNTFALSIYRFDKTKFQIGFPSTPQVLNVIETEKLCNINYLSFYPDNEEEEYPISYSVNVVIKKEMDIAQKPIENINISELKENISNSINNIENVDISLLNITRITTSKHYEMVKQLIQQDDLYVTTWIFRYENITYSISVSSFDNFISEQEANKFIDTFEII